MPKSLKRNYKKSQRRNNKRNTFKKSLKRKSLKRTSLKRKSLKRKTYRRKNMKRKSLRGGMFSAPSPPGRAARVFSEAAATGTLSGARPRAVAKPIPVERKYEGTSPPVDASADFRRTEYTDEAKESLLETPGDKKWQESGVPWERERERTYTVPGVQSVAPYSGPYAEFEPPPKRQKMYLKDTPYGPKSVTIS